MNNKLVEVYLEGIICGYISVELHTMSLNETCPIDFSIRIIDLEHEVYPQFDILSPSKTRRLPEFKRAVELSKTPLAGALT